MGTTSSSAFGEMLHTPRFASPQGWGRINQRCVFEGCACVNMCVFGDRASDTGMPDRMQEENSRSSWAKSKHVPRCLWTQPGVKKSNLWVNLSHADVSKLRSRLGKSYQRKTPSWEQHNGLRVKLREASELKGLVFWDGVCVCVGFTWIVAPLGLL